MATRLAQIKHAESDLKTREAELKVLTDTRDLRIRQRRELRAARDEMRLEVRRIAKALLEERLEQEKTKVAADDGGLPPVRQDLKSLRERVRLLQETRRLQGGVEDDPIGADQAARQRRAQEEAEAGKRWGTPTTATPTGTNGQVNATGTR